MSREESKMKRRLPLLLCVSLLFIFHSSLFTPLSAQVIPVRDDLRQSRTTTRSYQQQQQSNNLNNNDSLFVDSTGVKGLEYHKETPDSVLRQKVFFFHHPGNEVKIDEVWNPTLDPTGVQHSDPIDAFNGNYYLGTGVIGHPHIDLYSTLADGIQPSLMYSGFDAYLKTIENIRFYQTQTPYTVLSYNSSLKKDYLLHVAHTQNIIPGWNVALDYRLQCPEGAFANSGAKDHFLDFTTNYFSVDSRLQVQAGFIWQSFDIDENGGLTNDSYFTAGTTSNPAGLPMRFSNASSTHLRHDAFIRASYNSERQVERYRERDSLVFHYDTVNADSVNLVVDTLVITDTLHVGTPHVINPGVLGAEARYSRWTRASHMPSLCDSSRWGDLSATLFWTNDAYPDHRWHNPLKVTLGVTARSISALIGTDTLGYDKMQAFSAFNPFAEVKTHLWKAMLSAKGELDYTLLNLSVNNAKRNSPDYHGAVTLSLPFDSAGHSGLDLTGVLQRQMPEVMMMYRAGAIPKPILAKRFELHLFRQRDEGLLRLVDLNLRASHLDHNLWYDSLLFVEVGTQDLWLTQAALAMEFQWGWFHVDMQQILQHSTDDDQFSVPTLSSKNSIYADFTLFRRALRMQIGIDIRYFSRFSPDGYDPATGLFYNQNTETGDTFWGDAFINLQIKRASLYIKAGHLNALWESHPHYFLLPHYPSQGFGLYWGATWHFFD
jgi:hypothetical protein